MGQLADRSILITGANAGLGFEAAAQLAEAGYGRIVLACRTEDKAERARAALIRRVGRDPFETLAVDVSSVAEAEAAVEELERRGRPLDDLLLNAGMLSGEQLRKTEDGVEVSFASSILGHHVLTVRLLEGGMLNPDARVLLAGSEAANDDVPPMAGMKHYSFSKGDPGYFGEDLRGAMLAFARGERPDKYKPTRYYAVTKLFSAWWSAAMARRYGDQARFFTVSPGASLGTGMTRNAGGIQQFVITQVLARVAWVVGQDHPVPVAARRYVDVLLDRAGRFTSGKTYTSAPRKTTGPLQEVTYPHVNDEARQEIAFGVVGELAGVPGRIDPLSSPA